MNYDNLIKEMKDFTLNANNIPIELISAFSEFLLKLKELNNNKPIFTENNIVLDTNNWRYLAVQLFIKERTKNYLG